MKLDARVRIYNVLSSFNKISDGKKCENEAMDEKRFIW